MRPPEQTHLVRLCQQRAGGVAAQSGDRRLQDVFNRRASRFSALKEDTSSSQTGGRLMGIERFDQLRVKSAARSMSCR